MKRVQWTEGLANLMAEVAIFEMETKYYDHLMRDIRSRAAECLTLGDDKLQPHQMAFIVALNSRLHGVNPTPKVYADWLNAWGRAYQEAGE